MMQSTRRGFLRRAVTGSAVAYGLGAELIPGLPLVGAEDLRISAEHVRFSDEIEPLVRLLEDTPRSRVLEVFAERIRGGTTYREVLTALLLAGVRNVQPRPSVGFKFHAVLVVNSAHLASQAAVEQERWLPIFWALDYFKSSQARDVSEGDWTMAAVNESAVPTAEQAVESFQQAMADWDESAADAATAGLVRSAEPRQVLEQFASIAPRDFRSIGHKAIFLANSWRTLETIGWSHAEPVMRSLAYALLNHVGEPNPARSDLTADRPWRQNQARLEEIPSDWLNGSSDSGATREIIQAVREQPADDVAAMTVGMLRSGVSVTSIYDGLFCAAGELLMRQPAIVALHALTTTNALHYLFRTVENPQTRQLTLLQNAAFLPMFRDAMRSRGDVGNQRIDDLQPGDGESSIAAVFEDVGRQRGRAAERSLQFLEQGGSAQELIQQARRMIVLKGTDSHDYKFSSAVLEDYQFVSPEWRNRFLAASTYKLRGAGEADSPLRRRLDALS